MTNWSLLDKFVAHLFVLASAMQAKQPPPKNVKTAEALLQLHLGLNQHVAVLYDDFLMTACI